MKLMYCPRCHDILSVRLEPRSCVCGESSSQYKDSLNAVFYGEAIPIGITNTSFIAALANRPKVGLGSDFTAFVIPKSCSTIATEVGDGTN